MPAEKRIALLKDTFDPIAGMGYIYIRISNDTNFKQNVQITDSKNHLFTAFRQEQSFHYSGSKECYIKFSYA